MRRSGSRLICLCVSFAALLVVPASAGATQRWASAESSVGSGTCAVSSPCRVEYAIEGAAAGDEVIVAPGTYRLSHSIVTPEAIELHGVAGQPRPRLIGSAATTALEFKSGGSMRHLAIEGTGSGQDALTLRDGLGEDLLLRSATGDGAKVNGVAILRDSVVQTAGTSESTAGLKVRDSSGGGDVTLVNVTVSAPGGSATGIRCELSSGQARIINSIVRGAGGDIDASHNGAACTARSSNFRPLLSPGVVAGSGNQQANPLFVNAAGGDLRPLSGSPTVDAGSTDPNLGASDPAGCPRVLGAAPDIGAYEYATPDEHECALAPPEPILSDPAPPSTGNMVLDEAIRGTPAPVLGRTVVLHPASGKVRVRLPAGRRFQTLEEAARVPVGSVVDASAGRVELVSSVAADGRLQAGRFWGSRFQVRQGRGGMTELILRGGNFAKCRRTSAHSVAVASRHRRIRSLWGSDRGGRFRTYGRQSQATVRGTRWLTEDRCGGTLTRVAEGAVSVRDRLRRKTVLVRAGHSYFARARR